MDVVVNIVDNKSENSPCVEVDTILITEGVSWDDKDTPVVVFSKLLTVVNVLLEMFAICEVIS